jgi:glycosyltransferase involved in cell wall biosynthesis
MKVSLIIPAYNAGKTIVSCLESALSQSLPKEYYEIIVVDDGSNDNTLDIVKNYPVRLIAQSNKGPAAARNRGASEASGDILVFTDSDCELDSNFLKNIILPFELENQIAGVQGSYETKQKEFISQFAQVEIETRYRKMVKNKYIDFIGTYAAAYKKDVFQKIGGFDEGFPLASGEDIDLSYRLYQEDFRMVFVPEAFAYHRHPDRLMFYLKSKFSRGYWRMRLCRKHPKKMLNDSYVPQSLKLQVLSIPVFFLSLLMIPFNILWWLPLFLVSAFFVFCSLPFYRIFKEHEYPHYNLIPVILFLRSVSLFAGMLAGSLNGIYEHFRR